MKGQSLPNEMYTFLCCTREVFTSFDTTIPAARHFTTSFKLSEIQIFK